MKKKRIARRAVGRRGARHRQVRRSVPAIPPPPPTGFIVGGPSQLELLTTREVLAQLKSGRTWLWSERRAGRFFEPVKLGAFHLRWRRTDLERWINERQRAGAVA